MRRPRGLPARRARRRHARQGRDRPRRHDPADDRPRPQVALPPAQGGAARGAARSAASRRQRLPRSHGQPDRAARRDPGPGRPRGLRPDLARPGPLRHRPGAGRRGPPRRRSPSRIAQPARRHRPRHLSGAGGPQALGPGPRYAVRENVDPARPAQPRALVAPAAAGPEAEAAERQRKRLAIKAPSIETPGGDALGRQPAEGGAGQMAGDAPAASSSSTSPPAASTSVPRARSTA